MHSIGPPELFAMVGVIGLLVCGVIFVCIWKFYRLLSKMNDNLVGIKWAVESASLLRL